MSALRSVLLACLLSFALLAIAAASVGAAAGDLDLVSWPNEPELSSSGPGSADEPSISDDGRFVTYRAGYFPDGDPNCCTTVYDVVVRDLVTGETDVASRATGVNGELGNGDSGEAKISGNGRYVVFRSESDNMLGPGGQSVGYNSIYRRDLQTGTTILVRTSAFWLRQPDISDDGRYVTYVESNYDDDESTYVKDIQTGDVSAVSRANGPGATQSSYFSGLPSISGDGSTVSFFSFNAFDAHGTGGTYVRNLTAETTEMVSLHDGVAGEPFIAVAARPSSLSTNGRLVAFGGFPTGQTIEDPYPDSQIYVRDRDTNTTTLVTRPTGASSTAYEDGGANPSISGDGRYVAFDINARELRDVPVGDWARAVMVRDTVTNTTTEVSVNSEPGALEPDGASWVSAITADGSYVAFGSSSSTLSVDDDPYDGGIFRKDMLGGSAASITGPTLPGPKRVVTPPVDDPDDPPVITPPGNTPGPPKVGPRIGSGLFATGAHRLRRSIEVRGRCTPIPCTMTNTRATLRINGRGAGALKFTKYSTRGTALLAYAFKLSKKQYEAAKKALKRGKRVSASFGFDIAVPGGIDGTAAPSFRIER